MPQLILRRETIHGYNRRKRTAPALTLLTISVHHLDGNCPQKRRPCEGSDGFSITYRGEDEIFDSGTRSAVVFFNSLITRNMKESKPSAAKRVLVVDNDQDFRRYITDCLQAEGISSITASSVAEALEALAQENISALLVDWFLDHVAIEVVRKARSLSARMPIIVMSGKSYSVKADALMADADEFLEKTLGGTAVANRVKRWVGRLRAAPDVLLPSRHEDILLLDEVKYRYIRHVVQLVGNNISLAAQKLGVHRQTIYAAMANEEVEESNATNGEEQAKLTLSTRGVIETNDRE
jgi:two-component system, response regulator RegA